MNSTKKILLTAALAVMTGCATEMDDGDLDPPNEGISQALTSFTFDSTAVARTPAVVAPSRALALADSTSTKVASQLLKAPAPRLVASRGSTEQMTAGDWELERDSATGRVVANSLRVPTRPIRIDEAALKTDSMARLASFGVSTAEVGTVLQRKVMAQDLDGTGAPAAPTVHGYKTFIFRSVNGIPVVGHRAVISHGLDGQARKVTMTWPPLAKTGHMLRTSLSVAQIEARAAAALAADGESSGRATLSWRYVPQRTANGEVVLKLMAAAKVDGTKLADGTTEEPHLVDVAVDARQ